MPSKYEVLKARRESDPDYAERLREYGRKYRAKNIEAKRESDRNKASKKRSESRDAYNAYMREWTTRNKDRLNSARRERLLTDVGYAEKIRARERAKYVQDPENHRSIRLKSVYGITLADYRAMYERQGGKCAICGTQYPDGGKMGLVVDHCHKNGNVRKLLCTHCNKGIGQFRENVQFLTNAIEYLKEKE